MRRIRTHHVCFFGALLGTLLLVLAAPPAYASCDAAVVIVRRDASGTIITIAFPPRTIIKCDSVPAFLNIIAESFTPSADGAETLLRVVYLSGPAAVFFGFLPDPVNPGQTVVEASTNRPSDDRNVRFTVPGEYVFQAQGIGGRSATPKNFVVQITVPASRLAKISVTDGLEGTVGEPLETPFVVQVTDDGTPKAGVAITWQVTGFPAGATGTGLTTAASTTDANGVAQTVLTLGDRVGQYQVMATCNTCEPTTATFTATGVLTVKIEQITPPEVQPQQTTLQPGETPTAQVTVRVTGAHGRTVGSHPVTWTVEPLALTGGHLHVDGVRPRGSLTPVPACTTDTEGACTLTYTASEVGGGELLMAASGVDPTVTDAQPITVRVPGLGHLAIPFGPDASYRLTGQTPSHPVNHFGTSVTTERVVRIAAGYLSDKEATLGINDMSLVNGGLFDINNRWRPDHKLHRQGESIDIDRCALNPGTSAVDELCHNIGFPAGFVPVDRDRLREIVKKASQGQGCLKEEFPLPDTIAVLPFLHIEFQEGKCLP